MTPDCGGGARRARRINVRWTDPIPVRRRGMRASTHKIGNCIGSARSAVAAPCPAVPTLGALRSSAGSEKGSDRAPQPRSEGHFRPFSTVGTSAIAGRMRPVRNPRDDDQLKACVGAFVLLPHDPSGRGARTHAASRVCIWGRDSRRTAPPAFPARMPRTAGHSSAPCGSRPSAAPDNGWPESRSGAPA